MLPLLLSDDPPDRDLDLVFPLEEDELDLLLETEPLLRVLEELLLLLVTEEEEDLLTEEEFVPTELLLERIGLLEIVLVVLLMKLPTLFRKVFLSLLLLRTFTEEAGILLLLIRCLIFSLVLGGEVFTYWGSEIVRRRSLSSLTDSLLLSPLLLRVLVVLAVVSSFLRCTDRVRVVFTEFPLFLDRVIVSEEVLRVLLVPTVLGVDVVDLFPLFVTDCLCRARFESSVTVRLVPTPLGP